MFADANNERAHYFRGLAHVALGEYEEAIVDLTYSLAHNNDRGIAHLARGLAYLELGNKNDAALDFNGSSAFSEAELKSFKKLFGNKPFIIQSHGTFMIAVREGKDSSPLSILYVGKDSELQYQKKRFFYDEITDIYDRNMDREYRRAIMEVLSKTTGVGR